MRCKPIQDQRHYTAHITVTVQPNKPKVNFPRTDNGGISYYSITGRFLGQRRWSTISSSPTNQKNSSSCCSITDKLHYLK